MAATDELQPIEEVPSLTPSSPTRTIGVAPAPPPVYAPGMTDAPDPTPQDLANASARAAIAQKQNETWGRVFAWALGAFGPGPKHF